jgi:flagellar hook assembly protein FlgD
VVEPNLPNPFQRGTSFAFSTPTDGHVRLEVFDLTGRQVATPVDGELPAGPHAVFWNARGENGSMLAPGVYYYRVSTTGGTSETKRLLIVR